MMNRHVRPAVIRLNKMVLKRKLISLSLSALLSTYLFVSAQTVFPLLLLFAHSLIRVVFFPRNALGVCARTCRERRRGTEARGEIAARLSAVDWRVCAPRGRGTRWPRGTTTWPRASVVGCARQGYCFCYVSDCFLYILLNKGVYFRFMDFCVCFCRMSFLISVLLSPCRGGCDRAQRRVCALAAALREAQAHQRHRHAGVYSFLLSMLSIYSYLLFYLCLASFIHLCTQIHPSLHMLTHHYRRSSREQTTRNKQQTTNT